jgi:hypothetical protein
MLKKVLPALPAAGKTQPSPKEALFGDKLFEL